MESEDHLYITLPSSASMDLHPRNKISDFTTELFNTIHLDTEKFEIGLTEIILDAGIENVVGNQPAFTIYRNVEFVKKTLGMHNTEGIPSGRVNGIEYFSETFYTAGGAYNSISELVKILNNGFASSRFSQDLVFHTVKQSDGLSELVSLSSMTSQDLHDVKTFSIQPHRWFQNCVITTDNPPLTNNNTTSKIDTFMRLLFRRSPDIKNYIDTSSTAFTKSLHFVCNPSKLLRHPGMAYVYTDIVQPQYVGNTKASLFRVVHFPENNKVVTFPFVHYLQLSKTHLNSIRIYIRDVEGNPYPFTEGTAMCKVHIRRKLR